MMTTTEQLHHQLYLNGYGNLGVKVSTTAAALGTAFTGLLGGWDLAIRFLIGAMALDFLTGILKAAYCKHKGKGTGVDSEVMFWGGLRKGLVLVVVALGVGLDSLLPVPAPVCRTAIIYYYIGREGLSLVENLGAMGMKLPAFLEKVLAQLQDQGDKLDELPMPGEKEKE